MLTIPRLVKETDGFISRRINRRISTKNSVFLVRSRFDVSPNDMTVLSFLITISGALLFLWGFPLLGGVTTQASSILDGCDGEIARLTNRVSEKGGILDSILDRFADGALTMAITIFAYGHTDLLSAYLNPFNLNVNVLTMAIGFPALMGSYAVSYSAARIEASIGRKCKRLWSGRDVRLFIFMLAGIFARITPIATLLSLFIVTLLTFSV